MNGLNNIQAEGQLYDILAPEVVNDYVEKLGKPCVNPNGYTKGSLILASDGGNVQRLYKVTQAINSSQTITEGGNVVNKKLGDLFDDLETELSDVEDELSSQIQTLTNGLANETKARAANGAHNLAAPLNSISNWYGVTISTDSNGISTISGTSTMTGGRTFLRGNNFLLPKGSYIWSSSAELAIDMCLQKASDSSVILLKPSTSADASFTLSEDTYVYVGINVVAMTYNNVNLSFMIRLANDNDSTYQPYAMTNQQLTPLYDVPFDLDNTNESLASTASLYSLTSGNSYQNVLQYTATDELFGVATMTVNFVDAASTGARAVKFRIYRSGTNYRDVYETMILPTTITGEYQNVTFSLPVHLASGDIIMAYALQNSGSTVRVAASINFRGTHK